MATSRRHRDTGTFSKTPTPSAYFSFHSDLTSEGAQSRFLKLHVQLNNAYTHMMRTHASRNRRGGNRVSCAVAGVISPVLDSRVGLHIYGGENCKINLSGSIEMLVERY